VFAALPSVALLDRISELATGSPDRPAFVVATPGEGKDIQTYAELHAAVGTMADVFRSFHPGDIIVLAVNNHISYLSLVFGAWQAGLPVLLTSPWLPDEDREELLSVVRARLGRPVLVHERPWPTTDTLVLGADPLPSLVPAVSPGQVTAHVDGPPASYLYVTSGGATGLPKIIEYRLRFAGRGDMPYRKAGLADPKRATHEGKATRLICGNLFHTGNFAPSTHVLLTGSAVVTMTDFDPRLLTELLREHEVYSLGISPLHMMAVLTTADLDRSAFAGLNRVTHGAAPCPRWVKQGWIDLVGAEQLFEIYYSSELGGSAPPVIVRGDDWLRKPGTVGKPDGVRILGPDGQELPPGTVGEIYFDQKYGEAHDYVGDRALRRDRDSVSVADLGWLDEDGYLFLADRMSDVVEIDGHEVSPARVEQLIGSLPSVADVAAFGMSTEDGRVYLHALVQPMPSDPRPSPDEIRTICRTELAAHEVPAVVQLTAAIPRTPEGKMRRPAARSMATRP
jgi:bile acid-coenzyme A ligase